MPSDDKQERWTGFWEHKGATYRVMLTLAPVSGRYEVVDFNLTALTPQRSGVVRTVLREVPLGRLTSEALAELHRNATAATLMTPGEGGAGFLGFTKMGADGEMVISAGTADQIKNRDAFIRAEKRHAEKVVLPTLSASTGRNTGRAGRGYSPDHLERVADVYHFAVRMHRPPVKEVAAVFGIGVKVAARHVQRARQKNLIEPSPGQGRISRPGGN